MGPVIASGEKIFDPVIVNEKPSVTAAPETRSLEKLKTTKSPKSFMLLTKLGLAGVVALPIEPASVTFRLEAPELTQSALKDESLKWIARALLFGALPVRVLAAFAGIVIVSSSLVNVSIVNVIVPQTEEAFNKERTKKAAKIFFIFL